MNQNASQPILDDLLRPHLRVVFCGTQAGSASAQRRAYYAGRGNRFWRVLYSTGLTPELGPEEFRRLVDFGIGLTDVCKNTSGPDSALRRNHFDVAAFKARVEKFRPMLLAFNGKRAASHVLNVPGPRLGYGRRDEKIGVSNVFVLPSTSGAANARWDERPWAKLAKLVREQ